MQDDFLRGQMNALYDQIETLRAENAKLIAECDERIANKVFYASDKKLLDRLLAEREQWMKQAPYGYVNTVYKSFYQSHQLQDKKRLCEMLDDGEMIKVYANPVPPQPKGES